MAIYSKSIIQNINNWKFWIRKTNALLSLLDHRPGIDKTYFCVKDLHEANHKCLINKREKVDLKHYDDPKAFIERSNNM